jgi:hypothetical protein
MAAIAPTTQRVILNNAQQWRTWLNQLKAHTADMDFWRQYIDPRNEATAPPLPNPSMPEEHEFSVAYVNAMAAYNGSLQEPNPLSRPVWGIGNHTLTGPESLRYGRAFDRYKVEAHNAERPRKAYERVLQFLMDTCCEHAKSFIDPEVSLRENVQTLFTRFGMNEAEERRQAKQAYTEALVPPRNTSREAWDEWLINCEKAFQRSEEVGLASVIDRLEWKQDIVQALGSTKDSKAPVVVDRLIPDLSSDSIMPPSRIETYRDLVSAVRTEWDTRTYLFQASSSSTVPRRGAFPAISTDRGLPGQHASTSSGTRRARSSTSYDSSTVQSDSKKAKAETCKGCEGWYHQLEGCFIAFPGHPNKSTSFIEKLDSGGLSRRIQRWNELRTTPEVIRLVTEITGRTGWSNDLETNAQAGSEIQA